MTTHMNGDDEHAMSCKYYKVPGYALCAHDIFYMT